MLVAVFVAGFIGAPLWLIGYSIVVVVVVAVLDIAYRVRISVGYIIGTRLGTVQRENAELRQSLAEAHREKERATLVADSLSRKIDAPREVLTVTRNYVPPATSATHEQCIDDAMLIFDTAMEKGGSAASRESMCPGKLSQDRWEQGRDWLVSAKVLIYKTHRTKVWATTDRRVARAMLREYSTTSTTSH